MKTELERYLRYSRDIKGLLIVSGIWPNCCPLVQRISSNVALVTTAITFLGALNYCLYNISNIMLMAKGMGLVLSLLSAFLKICIVRSHREDILSLNHHLGTRFKLDLRQSDQQPQLLLHYRGFANLFYALTYSVGAASLTTGLLIPLLGLGQGKYIPVCPSKYPFDYEAGGLVYWLLQLIMMLASFFAWSVTCGVDSAFGLYTLQMCGELRLLANEFRDLSGAGDYRARLKRCIERHHLLIGSKDTLERVFGSLAIWLAVTSALIQCTLVFQATEIIKTMSPFKIAYVISFIVLKLVQAFMYAWFGHLIAEESELCLHSIYHASWPGCGDNRFMNDVLVILSQKPLVFTAKGCMSVKMEMFTKIVKSSLSYFFLLRTLNEDSQHY